MPALTKWQLGERRCYYYFNHRDHHPLFAAGVLSGGESPTAAIITVDANETVAACNHNRMPALLLNDDPLLWLTSTYKISQARDFLQPADNDLLSGKEVGRMGEI